MVHWVLYEADLKRIYTFQEKRMLLNDVLLYDNYWRCFFEMLSTCFDILVGIKKKVDDIKNTFAYNNIMYQRSELDYLIYNDQNGYADLIFNGDPETYLKTVTEYKFLDN